MGIISKSFVPANVLMGPADVYLGVPAPTSAQAGAGTAANLIFLDSNGEPLTVDFGPVTAATAATPSVVTLTATTVSGVTLANYNIIQITGCTGNYAQLNGIWTVTNVNTGSHTCTLSGSSLSSASGTLTGSHATAGQNLGLSEGPVMVSITPKIEEIRADQFESAIDAALTTIEAEIDVKMEEFNATQFQRYFTNDTLTNPQMFPTQTINSTVPTYAQVTQFGGQFTDACNQRTLMLVSADRSNIGYFYYVFAFRVYLKSAFKITFHRTAKTVFEMKFGCVCDFTRQPGDELLQMVRYKSSSSLTA
jgi:hypothetical protein